MGPRISSRFPRPHSSSTSVRAKGNAVPGPRLQENQFNIFFCVPMKIRIYLVIKLLDTTTDSSEYSKSATSFQLTKQKHNCFWVVSLPDTRCDRTLGWDVIGWEGNLAVSAVKLPVLSSTLSFVMKSVVSHWTHQHRSFQPISLYLNNASRVPVQMDVSTLSLHLVHHLG